MKTGMAKDASWRKGALMNGKGRRENIVSQTASKSEDMGSNEHVAFMQKRDCVS